MSQVQCFAWQEQQLFMSCKLQPKAAKDEFVEISEGRMKIRITAPPVDGKANKHLIKFLAKQFKVAQSNIDIISGETSKLKRIRISTPQVVPEALRRLAPEIAQVMDKQ